MGELQNARFFEPSGELDIRIAVWRTCSGELNLQWRIQGALLGEPQITISAEWLLKEAYEQENSLKMLEIAI